MLKRKSGFMLNKRSQAAMEFLMTYGWALLVVFVAVAALVFFGLLNPSRFLPDRHELEGGLMIQGASISESEILLVLFNGLGKSLKNVNISILECVSEGSAIMQALGIEEVKILVVPCQGPVPGSRFSSDLKADYISIAFNEEMNHTAKGYISMQVESVQSLSVPPCTEDADCSGLSCCNGNCVDLTSNPNYCGVCDTTCSPGDSCCNGVCTELGTQYHCSGCFDHCGYGNDTYYCVGLDRWTNSSIPQCINNQCYLNQTASYQTCDYYCDDDNGCIGQCNNNLDCGNVTNQIYCDGTKFVNKTITPICTNPGTGYSFCENSINWNNQTCPYACDNNNGCWGECSVHSDCDSPIVNTYCVGLNWIQNTTSYNCSGYSCVSYSSSQTTVCDYQCDNNDGCIAEVNEYYFGFEGGDNNGWQPQSGNSYNFGTSSGCGADFGRDAMYADQCSGQDWDGWSSTVMCSPTLDLTGYTSPTVYMDVWKDDETQWGNYYDVMDVIIQDSYGNNVIGSLLYGGPQWITLSYDVSNWAGQQVQVCFQYKTKDTCCSFETFAVSNIYVTDGAPDCDCGAPLGDCSFSNCCPIPGDDGCCHAYACAGYEQYSPYFGMPLDYGSSSYCYYMDYNNYGGELTESCDNWYYEYYGGAWGLYDYYGYTGQPRYCYGCDSSYSYCYEVYDPYTWNQICSGGWCTCLSGGYGGSCNIGVPECDGLEYGPITGLPLTNMYQDPQYGGCYFEDTYYWSASEGCDMWYYTQYGKPWCLYDQYGYYTPNGMPVACYGCDSLYSNCQDVYQLPGWDYVCSNCPCFY
jgi:hypothetical protein